MGLSKSLTTITMGLILFLCGIFSGYHMQKPNIINEEVIEYVYERDCYLEFEEREYKAKPLTIEDLEAL